MLHKIDKRIDKETKALLIEFFNKQETHYKNENLETEIGTALFILGYNIRFRFEHIRRIALAENSMNIELEKLEYKNYKQFLNGDKETLKSLIKKYFKLQGVYEFRG